jgi:hypothetical protein
MNILENISNPKAFLGLLAILLSQALWADTALTVNLQEDYSKTALPILRQSCFACHGPKPQNTDTIQNPDLKKQTDKAIAQAEKEFPIGETFPFPGILKLKADLKEFLNSLKKNSMPPKSQKSLNLGQPLSDQDKKTLLDWAIRTLKALN